MARVIERVACQVPPFANVIITPDCFFHAVMQAEFEFCVANFLLRL